MSRKKNRKINSPAAVLPTDVATHPWSSWVNSQKLPYLLLALILILGAGLRLYQVNRPLMWLDELGTIAMTTGQYQGRTDSHFPEDVIVLHPKNHSSIASAEPLPVVWKFFADCDVHPPLYHTLFYCWRILFGDSFASVRMLSTLPSIASLFVLFLLASELFDKRAALFSSLIMCLAIPQIVYAQEVRQYSLLTLFGLCAALIVVRIEKFGASKLRCSLLALAAFCLAITHYFSFGFLVGIFIYSLIRLRGKALACAVVGFLLGGIIFITVWGASFYNQFFGNNPNMAHFLINRQNAEIAKHCFSFLAGWPERLLFNLPPEYLTRSPVLLIIFLFSGIAILWNRNLLLPWLWLLCTAGFVWGMDYKRETYHFIEIRYTLLAAPALYMLISAGVFFGPKQAILNSIAPVIISAYLIFQIPRAYIPYKENWFEVAEIVKKNGGETDPIILPFIGEKWQAYWPQFIWTAISYYNYNPNRAMAIITKPLTVNMLEQIGWKRGAWLITRIPEFPQSASLDWPSKWIPDCKVDGAVALPDRVTLFHVTLPDAPLKIFSQTGGT